MKKLSNINPLMPKRNKKTKSAFWKCLDLHICERTTKARLTEKQVQSVLKYGNKKSLRRRYLHATKGWKERAY